LNGAPGEAIGAALIAWPKSASYAGATLRAFPSSAPKEKLMVRSGMGCYFGSCMPRHWFIGLCYSLIAALNIARNGTQPLTWIPWMLLAAGALTLVYTPVEEGGKMQRKIVLSQRNKASLAVTILGVVLLVFRVFHR
jgi:hypothetical protein